LVFELCKGNKCVNYDFKVDMNWCKIKKVTNNEGYYPARKVRHKFGKNCEIDSYFGARVKNCAIVT